MKTNNLNASARPVTAIDERDKNWQLQTSAKGIRNSSQRICGLVAERIRGICLMGRTLVCLFILQSQMISADLDFSLGFRDLAWGTSQAAITAKYPHPLAEFSLDHRTVYVIEPRVGLIFDDHIFSGVICSNLLGLSINLLTDVRPDVINTFDAKLTDSLSLSMSFADVATVLGFNKTKPGYLVKKKFGSRLCIVEFSHTERNEYQLYKLSLLPDSKVPHVLDAKPETAPQINF